MAQAFTDRRLVRRGVLLVSIVLLAALAMAALNARAHHGEFHSVDVDVLSVSAFPENHTKFAMSLDVELDDKSKQQVKLNDPNHVVVVRIAYSPEGEIPWHKHSFGPMFVVVEDGEITNMHCDDKKCVERTYSAGDAFISPGHDDVHRQVNRSGDTEAVILVTAFGVPLDEHGVPQLLEFVSDPRF